jgi:N6-L-threonylcarbamoyladenine synthase
MYILAFETSCDDTSIAIFEWDRLLAMETASQIKIHLVTNGVVPEVAAREHANVIFDVLQKVLDEAKLTLKDINYIAVTTNPGLIPSLLTWVTVASTLSSTLEIPIILIHHIEAHIFSNFLERKEDDIVFPLVCLTVSGWHTELYFMRDMWNLEKIWWTLDDAAGEAYDKVAKMMDLGYPGGPIISKLASEYSKTPLHLPLSVEKKKWLFPRVWLDKKELNFSFSGLKTAVKYEIEKRVKNKNSLDFPLVNEKQIFLSERDKQEIAYEFQKAVNEVLAYKLVLAWEKYSVKTLLLAGWVSANDDLRKEITLLAEKSWYNFLSPVNKVYSMDNAAMIGILAYYRVKYNKYEHFVGSLDLSRF